MGHDIDGETAANGARWIQVYEEEQEEEVCNAARERDAAEREAAMLQSVAEDDAADELVAAWAELVERTERHLEDMEAARAWGDCEHSVAASQLFAAGVARRSYLAGIVAWFRGR